MGEKGNATAGHNSQDKLLTQKLPSSLLQIYLLATPAFGFSAEQIIQ